MNCLVIMLIASLVISWRSMKRFMLNVNANFKSVADQLNSMKNEMDSNHIDDAVLMKRVDDGIRTLINDVDDAQAGINSIIDGIDDLHVSGY